MPCILTDSDQILTAHVFAAAFRYVEAPGDRILFDVIRGGRDEAGKPKTREVTLSILAEHVVDWSNVARRAYFDAAGAEVAPETVGAIVREVVVPFPAAGKRPRPAEATSEAGFVTDEEVAARVCVLRRLPWNVLLELDRVIGRAYVEAAASGKV